MHRRSVRNLTISVLAATALTAAGCSSSSSPQSNAASTSDPVTITVAVSNATNQTYLSLVLAQQLGYFKKQGVTVKVVSTVNGNQNWQDMLAHQVDGVIGFYDHNIDLRAKGVSTESVIQLNQAPGMVELVRTDEAASITSPAQESGKKLGITGLGSSTQFVADYLAVHNGVPVNQLHPVNIGAGSTFVAAMQNDEVDVGVSTEPTVSTLLAKKAAKIIVDMRSVSGTEAALGGPYPGTALSFETSYVQSNKPAVQKMVNALVEALNYIQTHSAAQIAAVVPAANYGSAGKTAYEQSLANEIGMFSPTGLMPADGPQSVDRVLSSFDPNVEGHNVDLSQTYTDSLVQAAASASN
ncbi:ABC transporter substrate-binding protein [Actinospica sp.]|jgi:NitT/TauT family transport system substrate-binding protein|uniref:ABC transporter substrate-binding protein n=1 Tax=Actinospica sp. TaxID=1872142 RepID=UPI002CE075EF|nr:ABC transporter substrate-binding protein [Actinospica sp.]HWG24768.1 ABC transporter substrate-binding protein [Actinospica sp.]